MSDYTRQQSGQSSYPPNPPYPPTSYPPNPKYGEDDGYEPADQPKDPTYECPEVPCDTPPPCKDPEKCLPDQDCNCPAPPPSSSDCLDDLIAQQTKQISEAESATAFKKELETLRTNARAASLEYTQVKYEGLVKEWWRLDGEISEFIRKLVCAVPCWRCVIECYVCPLLYEVRFNRQKLWGDGKLYTEVHSLSDLRYWHDRHRQAKKRDFDRIKDVLAAWDKPAQKIGGALADNKTLLENSGKSLSTDAMKIVYDVFLKLVPIHLAIAPPTSSGYTTRIAKHYTCFCDCDKGKPDCCCGPDVGEPSLRSRLIGPKPYLIDPKKFFSIICCLTEKRYLPAKNAYAKAQADWEKVDNEFKRIEAEITAKMQSIETDAKASFPLDCCHWEPKPVGSAR